MYQRRPRKFRRRPNGRGYLSRGDGDIQARQRSNSFSSNSFSSNSFSNGQIRNNYRTEQSAEKLLEKYNTLAKEALSSGDKTLSENYFQHADHFMRIIEDKNKNQKEHRDQAIEKSTINDKNFAENKEANKVISIEPKEEKKE